MKANWGANRRLVVRPIACAVLVWLGGTAMAGGDVVWPERAPQGVTPSQTEPMPPRTRLTTPNFQAPSATGCVSSPVFHEVAGPQSPPQIAHAAKSSAALTRPVRKGLPPSPPMPVPVAPAPVNAEVREAPAVADFARAPAGASREAYAPTLEPRQIQGPVTAGVVDDNADFGGYRQFLQRHAQASGLGRDISVRQRLQVKDASGRAVPDAEIAVAAANGAKMWARTDAGGNVWLHLNAFDDQDSARYQVVVRREGRQVRADLRRGQKNALEVVLPALSPPSRAQLDLVFMVDATGSMADEIDKLRASLQGIVREIGQLPSSPDICLGLVTYRDRGDEYFVRSWDLTSNVAAFQNVLDGVQANGGGDTPEAMNEAFEHSVQALSWRGAATTRLLVTLADAPPHMDYGKPDYSDTMLAALGKGIKVLSVAASGQDSTGEIVQRQMAQYTGGRFIFLTYKDANDSSSGAGTETVHDVANYSVDTLDSLVVKLVREELAQLPKR